MELAQSFRRKVVIVTGGGSGIGRATALLFAKHGARVAIVDRNEATGQETLQQIRLTYQIHDPSTPTAIFIKADVSVAEDVERFVKETVQTFGRIDCCFNNAGIESERSPIHLFSEENFDKVMQVNCKSVFLCMKYEIQQMLQQQANEREKKNYCIVNTASTAGMHGMPEFCAYAASKWAIIGLTKTAALEYAKNNIRVNALCPATTQTPMVERFQQKWPEWQEKTNKSYPLGRIGMPAEMAEAVVWMCSEACTWMTGHTLVIDGGQSC